MTKKRFFDVCANRHKNLTIIIYLYLLEIQWLTKKLQKGAKKNTKNDTR